MSADLGRHHRRGALARRRARPSGTPRGTPWGAALAVHRLRAFAPATARGLTTDPRPSAPARLTSPTRSAEATLMTYSTQGQRSGLDWLVHGP